jgi:ribosomal protein S21|tara:strand:+ start:901 stop:1179 length:279 start_codon:yes stop_codon:yes gene_type:complete
MKNRPNRQKEISGVVTVNAKECGGDPEKMVRRFIKKVKKEGIIDEFRDRRYYKKPTVAKAEEKRNRKRLIEKINKKREELFTTTKTRAKRRK